MVYSTKLGDKICEHTATSSIGLRHICKQLALPYSTVTNWIYDDKHEMYYKYTKAKTMQLHHIAEEILEIADDSTNDYMEVIRNGKKKIIQNKEAITRSRLRIQTRLSLLTKLAPFGHRNGTKERQAFAEPFACHPQTLTPQQQARMDTYMDGRGTGEDIYGTFARYSGSAIPDQMDGDLRSPARDKALGSVEGERVGERSKKIPSSSPKNNPKPAPDEEYLSTPGRGLTAWPQPRDYGR